MTYNPKAYALSWRTSTRMVDAALPKYEEVSFDRIPDEPFSTDIP